MKKIYLNYTNEEKSDYKIGIYTRELCTKLQVHCTEDFEKTMIKIFKVIKQTHGSKRAKIKDSIIIVCISKIQNLDPIILASSVGIENKYIYNTQKIFVEIPQLEQFIFNDSSFEYIKRIYNSFKHSVSHIDPLDDCKKLIEYCDKNDILIESKSITIGAACLYYTLIQYGYNIDLDKFTETYGVSKSTINKCMKILEAYIIQLIR